ncbi:ferric reductase-like transmembrane domain-containing protein [Pseudomonas sp. PDM16]|uniref:ferric reductase-like transmembrane domain-containing protein n=1 Tax=Pseudomonas sp. PDM16 TaxID=2769292 RepID=UPI001783F6A5|nr:ferric reductase-like transmembrane domain-containing protein [Pseudomonas sp. PDM16]MBD9416117.1 ferric reductase-like transmembrane domain-containing protein [Pseudomonas sp. PDM16]
MPPITATTTAPASLHGWRLFSLLALLVIVATALALLWQPQLVEALRSAIRVTARTSFALFLLAFLASSLALLVPSPTTRALLRERRFFGLAFAFSHLIHGVLILTYAQLFPELFWNGRSAATNIPGSVGYLFILLLALTSFPWAMKALGGRGWKALHSTGSWVLAVIFCLSFYKRIPMSPGYVLAFGLMFSAIVLKLVAKLAQRVRRNAQPARTSLATAR